jgi:hypothetical protein
LTPFEQSFKKVANKLKKNVFHVVFEQLHIKAKMNEQNSAVQLQHKFNEII